MRIALHWERESIRTVAAAVLMAALPLAAAIYHFQPVLPIRILYILQVVAAVFFLVVLARQFTDFKGAGMAAPAAEDRRPKSLAGLSLALVVTLAAYIRTIPLFFICDDFEHLALIRQPFVRSIWPQITQGQFDGAVHIFYRPLGFASLFLDYRLWHQWAPGYHLTNVALHLLSVAAVFLIAREFGLNDEICATSAVIFGVMPVNVQTVTWIACRFDQLATALMLWSLLFATRFRRTRAVGSYLAAPVLFFLAAITKESAYALPLLWFALEFLPYPSRDGVAAPRLASRQRLLPLAGYAGIAALVFLQRWHVLGGLGGYHESSGVPIAQHFGLQSLIGVLVRGPAEILFGNNTLQPFPVSPAMLLALTVVLVLALALLAAQTRTHRRLVWFSLIWILASILPAHFYFEDPYPHLFCTRVLYFGSAGAALLIGLLLESAFRKPQLRRCWTLALALVLVLGAEQSISAWQWVSDASANFLRQLKSIDPEPQPGTAFYIADVPAFVRGIPFFTVGLQNAVRFGYGERTDITAEPLTRSTPASLALQPNSVFVAWRTPHTQRWVALGVSRLPQAVRVNSQYIRFRSSGASSSERPEASSASEEIHSDPSD